jgi:glycogen(starch) synthase
VAASPGRGKAHVKVLFWTPIFRPDVGGIELLSLRHILGLRERGFEFAVVTAHGRVKAPGKDEIEGIPIHRLRIIEALEERDLSRIAEIRSHIAELRRSFDPDLEHLNFGGPAPLGYFYLTAAPAPPRPLLVALHGSLEGLSAGPDSITGRVLRRAAWTTACSESVLRDARRVVPEISPASSVVYYGLPAPDVAPEPLPFEPPLILCLGRLVEDKGFDLAVDAWAELAGSFPRARLVIAGDGPARPALERRVRRRGLESSVAFTGEVDPAAVPRLINRATIVVVPSRYSEALGLVAVEAAQMERPVVAARAGGLAEAVADGETGLLVDRESGRAVAEAVACLLRNPDLARRMGRNGRVRARDRFAWPGYLDSYARLYEDHLGKRRS